MKSKKCKVCKNFFVPIRELQPTCTDYDCMVEYANKHLSKKAKKKKTQSRKEKQEFNWNDKKWLKETAQKEINKYGRLRDEKENGVRCCTCSNPIGKADGGHFLPTSSYSAIRYNTNQIHQQCVNCNRHNGGRYKEYKVFMINKYGLEYVEGLEATKGVLRSYNVEYYQKLIRIVRKKIKRLQS